MKNPVRDRILRRFACGLFAMRHRRAAGCLRETVNRELARNRRPGIGGAAHAELDRVPPSDVIIPPVVPGDSCRNPIFTMTGALKRQAGGATFPAWQTLHSIPWR